MSGSLIRHAAGAADLDAARALFKSYEASLGISLDFQGFACEVAALPGDYVAPHGGLWLAGPSGQPTGCVALRALPPDGGNGRGAELKRLYVCPAARGTGLGRALAASAIGFARAAGYDTLKLDTLASMTAARALYASMGFVPCAPYYDNPLDGTAYLALAL